MRAKKPTRKAELAALGPQPEHNADRNAYYEWWTQRAEITARYRKISTEQRVPCPTCGMKFLPASMEAHRRTRTCAYHADQNRMREAGHQYSWQRITRFCFDLLPQELRGKVMCGRADTERKYGAYDTVPEWLNEIARAFDEHARRINSIVNYRHRKLRHLPDVFMFAVTNEAARTVFDLAGIDGLLAHYEAVRAEVAE